MPNMATQMDGDSTEENAVLPESIILQEGTDQTKPTREFETIQLEEGKKKKVPRRILHFSDGTLEEYSTDEEEEEETPSEPPVDPKTLTWMPYIWYHTVSAAMGTLAVCDYLGEKLAWFFGITTPKYQYAIDEYYRNLKEEEEEAAQAKREWEEEHSRLEAEAAEELDRAEGGGATDEVNVPA
ncbi:protein FAM177A1-like [Ptychodera flava]|uniref:protein FAM177A1-like n=1 Tax=Ptychodera flava TaxID=63121 RepID=UPI00396A36FF